MPSETGFEKVIDAHGGYVLPGLWMPTVISECGKTESAKKEPTETNDGSGNASIEGIDGIF